jgi:hypothetical protein
MAMLDELAAYLQTYGIGTVGVDIWKEEIPETPDAAMRIHETPGGSAEGFFGSTSIFREHASVQVTCRGASRDWKTPNSTADSVYQALFALQNVTLADTVAKTTSIYYESQVIPPFHLKLDEQQRVYVVVNARLVKSPSVATP